MLVILPLGPVSWYTQWHWHHGVCPALHWRSLCGSGVHHAGLAFVVWVWRLSCGSGVHCAGVCRAGVVWVWCSSCGCGIHRVGLVFIMRMWHSSSGCGIRHVGIPHGLCWHLSCILLLCWCSLSSWCCCHLLALLWLISL
jgi:hypothetical protein